MILYFYLFFMYLCQFCLYGMQDNCHFYRASHIFFEPRFDRDWLSTLEASIGQGSTRSGRNAHGKRVSLFAIENCSDTSREETFHIAEANLLYIQNFIRGFFIQAHLPVRSLRITTHSASPHTEHHVEGAVAQGDFTIHTGYTYSYQYSKKLDFIDITARCGLLIPTAPTIPRIDNLLTISYGYNGHWGFPLAFDLSFGAYEWLTIAVHASVLLFTNTMELFKNSAHTAQQNDPQHVCSRYHNAILSPLWHTGMLIKTDHIMRGISCTLGYSYAHQDHNTRSLIHGFSMHTLHFSLEYDCLRQEYWLGPRIALFYNHILSGRSIFDTDMVIGQCGLEIAWHI